MRSLLWFLLLGKIVVEVEVKGCAALAKTTHRVCVEDKAGVIIVEVSDTLHENVTLTGNLSDGCLVPANLVEHVNDVLLDEFGWRQPTPKMPRTDFAGLPRWRAWVARVPCFGRL